MTEEEKQEAIKNRERYWREFWAEYPKQVNQAKARRAYMQKCKNEKMAEEIITGLREALWDWDNIGDLRYIPNPANWLNDERWKDVHPSFERFLKEHGF